ncbi:ribonuclease III [Alkaliphilus metalliredigens QYMF]|uniref:Mini-ribonuclease 3 n=1 Tax=Alkaliphilus metalliredigens (strain QYMF) TaxID=293826 RepID=A6TWK4_ALKMQ|nr:ribonuclease III domain-containing protein [Alkaliphilus metalliredigens]ABR50572.1 ribonuclease III [Alkaliphilus metalliredigens QYMF]
MEDFLEKLQENQSKKVQEVRAIPPLVLAYIGDAIFEVYVRNHLITQTKMLVGAYHRDAIGYVKAQSQATIVRTLEAELSEEEWRVIKKGRNQKPATVPKNADLMDYKYATGFEALIGYLFYMGKTERLMEVMSRSMEILDKR